MCRVAGFYLSVGYDVQPKVTARITLNANRLYRTIKITGFMKFISLLKSVDCEAIAVYLIPIMQPIISSGAPSTGGKFLQEILPSASRLCSMNKPPSSDGLSSRWRSCLIMYIYSLRLILLIRLRGLWHSLRATRHIRCGLNFRRFRRACQHCGHDPITSRR